MQVSFLEEKRFVWAQFSGSWNIEELPGSIKFILEECRKRKQVLLLIDLLLLESGRISTLERYRMGMGAAALAPGITRMACFGRPDQLDPERFGETVARNRGLDIRVFTDLEESQRWLLEAPPSEEHNS